MPEGDTAKDRRSERADFQGAGEAASDVGESFLLPVDQQHATEDLLPPARGVCLTEVGFQDELILPTQAPGSPQPMGYPPASVVSDEHLACAGSGASEGLAEQEVALPDGRPHADAGGLDPEARAHGLTHDRSWPTTLVGGSVSANESRWAGALSRILAAVVSACDTEPSSSATCHS
jgi:hypothetical protein